jgi:uncharacterized protein (TIGR02598 family)
MRKPKSYQQCATGFSLVEVALAVGIISFAFVAILGIFPKAMDASRTSIVETRAAQLARSVFATIQSQAAANFTNCNCYGKILDLTALDASSPVMLYAQYPVQTTYSSTPSPQPIISSSTNSIYTIKLNFNNTPPGFVSAGVANLVTVSVYPQTDTKSSASFSCLIAKF